MSGTSSMKGELSSEGRGDSPARLIVADDHSLVREGLLAVLEGEPDLKVVGEAKNGREALSLCRRLIPDLVLMDVRMPEMDGLEATRRVKEELPQTSVMMVTMHENPDYLLEAIRAGAAGYILKDAVAEKLVEAVRRTLEGEALLDESLAMQLLQRLAAEKEQELPPQQRLISEGKEEGRGYSMPEAITAREAEVLRLLAQGKTNPQIGRTLLFSTSTVKVHVQSIIAKLGVSDRTQAAVRAIELGLATSGVEDR